MSIEWRKGSGYILDIPADGRSSEVPRPPESVGRSAERRARERDLPPEPSSPARGRGARIVLPDPVSARHAISTIILGFAVEGGTEAYQYLARGNLAQGPLVYYTTLATTILGFYLMFLGFREWNAFYPKPQPTGEGPPKVRRRWFLFALWAGGTGATALLSLALESGGVGYAPFWIAWPVGGLLVLAFGDFFFGLRKLAMRWGSAPGNVLGWVAFVWSLAIGTVAGLAVGDRVTILLFEFVSNWVALVASLAPIVVAMSPLAVTYALLICAYWPARRLVPGRTL
jgi:hypothetical protein